LEAVFASSIASDARVQPGVGQTRRVNDERADAFLVDHDLVQEIGQNFCAVSKPQHVWDGPARHHAVEACQMTFRYFKVSGNFAKYWLEVRLRHAAKISLSKPAWAVKHAHNPSLILIIHIRPSLRSLSINNGIIYSILILLTYITLHYITFFNVA